MDKKEQKMMDAVKELAESYSQEIHESAEKIAENVFVHGASMEAAFAIPKKKMEGLYLQAYQHYNAGSFRKAFQTFQLLASLNGDEPRYQFGMGACLHMLKEYQAAISCYTQSAMQDVENPVPYYHAGDCAMQLDDDATALLMFHMTIKLSEGKDEFKYIQDRSKLLKDSLLKKMNKKGVAP